MQLRDSEWGPCYGHGGWFPGYRTEVAYFPRHRVAIAVQFNTDDGRSIIFPRDLLPRGAKAGELLTMTLDRDVEGTADALFTALELPAEDRRRRAEGVREHVRQHDVRAWISAQLADLEALRGVE